MTTRGVFLLGLCMGTIALAAACGSVKSGSPTPSITPVPSATPTDTGIPPTPTPTATDTTTAEFSQDTLWRNAAGTEVWYSSMANFNGSITAVRIQGATVATLCSNLSQPALFTAVQGYPVFFVSPSSSGGTNCHDGNYQVSIDYADENNPPCEGCVSTYTTVVALATSGFQAGYDVVSGVTSSDGTIGLQDFNVQVITPVEITDYRLYTAGNDFLSDCNTIDVLPNPGEPNLFDTCAPPATAGDYNAVFQGTITSSGAPYYQYVPFTYSP